jgi:ubiquinol-cytochrome c reductase cytochrome b subunit
MSAPERQTNGRAAEAPRLRLARPKNFGVVLPTLADAPSRGISAWARTTAGVVAFLLLLQIATGLLLAFYYVPSAESAHLTVSYIEKATGAGSWIRALHYHGSQWLPLALALHLAQMLSRRAYRRRPIGWLSALLLLALALAAGATGYSLPWDARAFYATRVAESIAGGLPLFGETARAWLVGGANISTLTVSRFYALHVLVIPFLILLTVAARLFLFREGAASDETNRAAQAGPDSRWIRAQLARNAVVIALVFAALAFCALSWPAPLGPAVGSAAPGYLPRPGAQFLWLFQLLKYLPSPLASLTAVLLPGLLLGALALVPFLADAKPSGAVRRTRPDFGVAVFALGFLLVAVLTALAYIEDARNPSVREQLARQAEDEETFRRAPFVPRTPDNIGAASVEADGATSGDPGTLVADDSTPPPAAYTANCAKCHGARGEGKSINPRLIGVSAQPRRTVTDLVSIMNDPRRYGLEKRMPSFADKLSEEEKQAIAEWLSTLK